MGNGYGLYDMTGSHGAKRDPEKKPEDISGNLFLTYTVT